MSMDPKVVAYGSLAIAGAAITSSTRYNCTVVRTATGRYTATLGEGGVDITQMIPAVVAQTDAAGGAGSARACSVISTSDTVKEIQIRDDAGALADPTHLWFCLERLPTA